jgi:hypothetical protein
MKKTFTLFFALIFPALIGVKARADGKNAIFQPQSFSGILKKSLFGITSGVSVTVSNYDSFGILITFQPHGSASKVTIFVPPHVQNEAYNINLPDSGVCNVTFQLVGGSANGDYYDNQGHNASWVSPAEPNGVLITFDSADPYSIVFT